MILGLEVPRFLGGLLGKLEQALDEAGGKKVKAAKLLKISRSGLYNKLRDYGLA